MEEEKNSAQIYANWRILPELHHEIGVASKTWGVPMYELAEQSWKALKNQRTRDGISTQESPENFSGECATLSDSGYAAQNREWHELLEEILLSGVTPFIDGILANLKAWGGMVRVGREIREQIARDSEAPRSDTAELFAQLERIIGSSPSRGSADRAKKAGNHGRASGGRRN